MVQQITSNSVGFTEIIISKVFATSSYGVGSLLFSLYNSFWLLEVQLSPIEVFIGWRYGDLRLSS